MALDLPTKKLLKSDSTIEPQSGVIYDNWKWIIDNATLVEGHGSVADQAESTLYTVPAGKVLYLIAATVSFVNTDTLPDYGGAYIRTDQSDMYFVIIKCPTSVEAHDSVSVSFTIPIKIAAGKYIRVGGDKLHQITNGTFQGYLLDA